MDKDVLNYCVTDAAKTVRKLVAVSNKKCVPEHCSKLFGIPMDHLRIEMYLPSFDEYVDVDDVTMLPVSAKLRVQDARGQRMEASFQSGSVSNISLASTLPVEDLSAGYVILLFNWLTDRMTCCT